MVEKRETLRLYTLTTLLLLLSSLYSLIHVSLHSSVLVTPSRSNASALPTARLELPHRAAPLDGASFLHYILKANRRQ